MNDSCRVIVTYLYLSIDQFYRLIFHRYDLRLNYEYPRKKNKIIDSIERHSLQITLSIDPPCNRSAICLMLPLE